MSYLLAAAATAAASGAIALLHHQRRRRRLYRHLAKQRAQAVTRFPHRIVADTEPAALQSDFAHAHIVRVAHFIAPDSLAQLQSEALENAGNVERSHIPGHKKGGTLSYERIHHSAPACLALYHAPQMRQWLSVLTGEALFPAADHDQSACSLLYYDRGGDHIGWHYDHNFYRGRHFTVLLSLLNRADGGDLSHGRLQQRRQGNVTEVDTAENTLVVFEGARVLHRATAVADGDRRVMLSMTYCSDPRIGRFKELARRIKDTAYYGPRVLFD